MRFCPKILRIPAQELAILESQFNSIQFKAKQYRLSKDGLPETQAHGSCGRKGSLEGGFMSLSPEIGGGIKIMGISQRFESKISAIAWDISDGLVSGPGGLDSGCHTLGQERDPLIDKFITE
ncbi:MAG: hypothetical protein Q9212_002919 [Teloschistes hypoglaucus]